MKNLLQPLIGSPADNTAYYLLFERSLSVLANIKSGCGSVYALFKDPALIIPKHAAHSGYTLFKDPALNIPKYAAYCG